MNCWEERDNKMNLAKNLAAEIKKLDERRATLADDVERARGELDASRESALRDGHLGYVGFAAHKSITSRIQFAARSLYITGECRAALVQLLYFSGQVFC